jgi:hypothetical protein
MNEMWIMTKFFLTAGLQDTTLKVCRYFLFLKAQLEKKENFVDIYFYFFSIAWPKIVFQTKS